MSQAHTLPPRIAPVSFEGFSRDFPHFSDTLGASFERFGFAVISDHGIAQARIDAALAAAKRFFALPEAEKLKYKLPVGGQRGYTPFGVETAKGETNYDLKEFWHVGRDLPPGHPYRSHMADNVWPDAEVAEFHETVGWLYGALDQMGLKVLEAIATYLGLERHFFGPTVDFGNSILRLLHYPPVPADGGVELGDLGVRPDVVGHVVAVAVAGRQVAPDVPEFLEVVVGLALGGLDAERRVAALAAHRQLVLELLGLGQGKEPLAGLHGRVDARLGDAVIGDHRKAEPGEGSAQGLGEGGEVAVELGEGDGRDAGRKGVGLAHSVIHTPGTGGLPTARKPVLKCCVAA